MWNHDGGGEKEGLSVWPTSTPAPTQAFLQGLERGEQGAGKGLRRSKRIGEGQLGVREESPGGSWDTCIGPV